MNLKRDLLIVTIYAFIILPGCQNDTPQKKTLAKQPIKKEPDTPNTIYSEKIKEPETLAPPEEKLPVQKTKKLSKKELISILNEIGNGTIERFYNEPEMGGFVITDKNEFNKGNLRGFLVPPKLTNLFEEKELDIKILYSLSQLLNNEKLSWSAYELLRYLTWDHNPIKDDLTNAKWQQVKAVKIKEMKKFLHKNKNKLVWCYKHRCFYIRNTDKNLIKLRAWFSQLGHDYCLPEVKYLHYLDLSNKRLDHLPLEISILINLKYLNLSLNNFKYIPYVNKNLKELDMHFNEIYNVSSSDLEYLGNIEKLNLAYNKIEQLPTDISKLVHIKSLNLSGMLIKQIPSSIKNCNNLEELYLADNFIELFPIEICYIPKLKILYLGICLFHSAPPEIKELKNLKTVYTGISLKDDFLKYIPGVEVIDVTRHVTIKE